MKNWFDVDTKGLRSLQLGKPKHYAVRELIQNAFDEDITVCRVSLQYDRPHSIIEVYDNSPEGFKNIRDAYTLFADTRKRTDPTKRGRFNLGEKQAICISDVAIVSTTKGTITFDSKGRHESKKHIERGSVVTLKIRMTEEEFDEMVQIVSSYHSPKNISYVVNDKQVEYREPLKTFEVSLKTELEDAGAFSQTIRKTQVNLYEEQTPMLYEIGIPVVKIDCKYSIDVMQKIPLGKDRDTVPESYLKDLYAEVLNHTAQDINSDDSSQNWVHIGMSDDRIQKDTVKTIITQRYGDKVVFANPFDRRANDDAIAHGYKVIERYEVGSDERTNIKQFDLIKSSTELFGMDISDSKQVQPNSKQAAFADYAKKIAARVLGIKIQVSFVESPKATVLAQYCRDTNHMTVNVSHLHDDFFVKTVCYKTTDLILHELGHSRGMHTEESYHRCITEMAGKLIDIALAEPEFFKS